MLATHEGPLVAAHDGGQYCVGFERIGNSETPRLERLIQVLTSTSSTRSSECRQVLADGDYTEWNISIRPTTTEAHMGPTKIMIIRHGEKPVPSKVQGVRARGEWDDASLTPLGWQRAGALVEFFERPRSPHITCPDHIFAARFDVSDVSSSRRSKQTVRPLSNTLGIDTNDRFGSEQEERLARALRRISGVVLIAWPHENIPKLVSAIGVGIGTPSVWPDDRFDLAWVFERTPDRTTEFTQVPQRLLAGDRDSVIPAGRTG